MGAGLGSAPETPRTSVSETSAPASRTAHPETTGVDARNRIGRERGWPPTTRAQFEFARGPRGALFVGSAAELVDKILAAHEIFRFDRVLIQMAIGVIERARLMRAIEILGTQVAPAVRKAVGARSGAV